MTASDDDLLAAEYVMGLLDLEARTSVQTRLRNDQDFAASVASWEQRLSGLNDDYADVPAPNLLPQIEARLFPAPPKRRWLGTLWTWGTAATAAVALVAYLALTPPTPDFVASLTTEGSPLRYEAVITQDRLTLTRVTGAGADSTKVHELWLIAGDNPPVSLGVIPGDLTTIALPGVAPGVVLAITEEQPGGSPDGKPHGPIIAMGALTAA